MALRALPERLRHCWVTGGRRRARPEESLADRYQIAVILGAGLGLRHGEMFGLSPDDVDWPLIRNHVNHYIWKPALERAGVQTTRPNGMHALRHHYASVLLDAGESIKASASTSATQTQGFPPAYTHLMPSGDERTRRADDQVFACYMSATSGPEPGSDSRSDLG